MPTRPLQAVIWSGLSLMGVVHAVTIVVSLMVQLASYVYETVS